MDWSEVFSYKNGVLYWKVKSCRRNDVNIGDVAGSLCKNGYWYVMFGNRKFKRSRVVYEMFSGKIPKGFVIDHTNHDTCDDRIENLSCKSRRDNMVNVKRRKDNTSGVTGVARKGKTKWRAYAVVNGRQISKTFDRIEDAFAERIYMSVANRFHINHGLTTFNNGYK